MLNSELIEDVKDDLVETLGSSYHVLNRNGQKHFLDTIEPWLAALTAAFLLPFFQKLSQQFADWTWERLRDAIVRGEIPENIPRKNFSEALEAAENEFRKCLLDSGVPPDAIHKAVEQLRTRVNKEFSGSNASRRAP